MEFFGETSIIASTESYSTRPFPFEFSHYDICAMCVYLCVFNEVHGAAAASHAILLTAAQSLA